MTAHTHEHSRLLAQIPADRRRYFHDAPLELMRAELARPAQHAAWMASRRAPTPKPAAPAARAVKPTPPRPLTEGELADIERRIAILENHPSPRAAAQPQALGLPPDQKRALDIAMGILETTFEAHGEGAALVLGGTYRDPRAATASALSAPRSSAPTSGYTPPPARLDPEAKARLDAMMGLAPSTIAESPTRLTLG